MRVDNKIYWNLFQNLFTETTLLLECRQHTKKKTKTKLCQNQRVHYRKKRVGEGGQGMFEIVGTCVLSHVWRSASSWLYLARLLRSWDFPGKNIGVGYCFLFRVWTYWAVIKAINRADPLSYCFLGRICWWCLTVFVSLSLELQAVYKVPTSSWIAQEFSSFCSEQSYFPRFLSLRQTEMPGHCLGGFEQQNIFYGNHIVLP